MENNEPTTNKIPIAAKIDPTLFTVIEQMARDDDRSISNMVERLLKASPQVAEVLEAETAAVTA